MLHSADSAVRHEIDRYRGGKMVIDCQRRFDGPPDNAVPLAVTATVVAGVDRTDLVFTIEFLTDKHDAQASYRAKLGKAVAAIQGCLAGKIAEGVSVRQAERVVRNGAIVSLFPEMRIARGPNWRPVHRVQPNQ